MVMAMFKLRTDISLKKITGIPGRLIMFRVMITQYSPLLSCYQFVIVNDRVHKDSHNKIKNAE